MRKRMLNEVASLLLIFLSPVTPYEQECEPDAQEGSGCRNHPKRRNSKRVTVIATSI
jgi:hypothetical protein